MGANKCYEFTGAQSNLHYTVSTLLTQMGGGGLKEIRFKGDTSYAEGTTLSSPKRLKIMKINYHGALN